MSTTVKIAIVPANAVSEALIQEMWALYKPLHAIDIDAFQARIRRGIDRVALYRHAHAHGGALIGFTGLRVQRFELPSGPAGTIYVGMTFIDRAFRGQNLIQRTVIRTMLPARLARPLEPLFFWSDCISYKPYLLAARNLYRYYPAPDWETPPLVRELIDAIGEACYPETYVGGEGVVKKPARLVLDETTVITPDDLRDRHIRFYAARNPGHARGDGLIAIFPITAVNLAYFLMRQAAKRLLGGAAFGGRVMEPMAEARTSAARRR